MEPVTLYAFDPDRHALLAVWNTGQGNTTRLVAELPPAATDTHALALATTLGHLSDEAWRTYTHPASAADSLEVNTDGWRRDGEREAFGGVAAAIREPNLPSDGSIIQSYIAVEENAHRVGRALHAIGDTALTDEVVADVEAELAAVEQAERGELTGRAQQAFQLTRADASPLQIAAADALFRTDPLGREELFTTVDPTAASVAAAHWLYAAAQVAGEAAGVDPTLVVAEADNITALPVRTPTIVLECLDDDQSPREVVLGLIAEAMLVADGHIPDLPGLLERVAAIEEQAEAYGDRAEEIREALTPDRLTPLDPSRPAQDLLEDLIAGIHGCLLLYREHAYDDELENDPDDGSDKVDEEMPLDGEPVEEDDEYDDELHARIDAEFTEAVRAAATAAKNRLT